MVLWEIAQQVFLAVALGAIVGIEREHRKVKAKVDKTIPMFGLRTAILFSILGFLFAFISVKTGYNFFLILGALMGLIIATTIYVMKTWILKYTGATTYVAMMVVLFVGMLIGLGGYNNYILAGAIAILTTIFLASKEVLIKWTKSLTDEDIICSLKFAIVAFVILPFLPNTYIDPWGIFNPFQFWTIVVIISAISFISYILLKAISGKALVLLGLFGGLISSSPTAYAIANLVKGNKKLRNYAVSGVFMSSVGGILSDIVVIAAIWGTLYFSSKLMIPQLVGLLSVLLFARIFYKKHKLKESVRVAKPIIITPAIEFALFYFILTVISAVVQNYFGSVAVFPVVIVGSIVSSSAVIASIASLTLSGNLTMFTSVQMIVAAFTMSLLIKYVWVRRAKDPLLIKKVLIGMVVSSILIVLTLYLQLI
jgi:uncharacterized membrane protein (DUF4010 family)